MLSSLLFQVAIEDGETIAIISRTYFTNGIGRISDVDLRLLKDLGYTVTSNKDYYVILWGDEINKDCNSNREVIDPIEIDFESLNNNYPDINKFFIK